MTATKSLFVLTVALVGLMTGLSGSVASKAVGKRIVVPSARPVVFRGLLAASRPRPPAPGVKVVPPVATSARRGLPIAVPAAV